MASDEIGVAVQGSAPGEKKLPLFGVLVAQVALTGYEYPTDPRGEIRLLTDPTYRAQGWVLGLQIVLTFFALWGVTVKSVARVPGLIATGFLAFVFWQMLELVPRSVEILTVSYDWAPKYLAASDPASEAAHLATMRAFDGIATGMGVVRRAFWALGHLLFGLAFVTSKSLPRLAGVLFLGNPGRLLLGFTPAASWVGGRLLFVALMVSLFGVLGFWLWRGNAATER